MAKRVGDHEIGLCTGKDCRRVDGFRTMKRELGRSCAVLELRCLDVCDGVVVVVAPRSAHAEVIERVTNRALALEVADHVVAGEELSGRLLKRRVTGAKRAKARRRVERSL
jgi:hypothetical protein